MRRNKLTMRSTFLLADEDNSETLTQKEFFVVVNDTLNVKISQTEQKEYWRRIVRGSATDTATFSQILTFFGGSLDAELLGRDHESLKTLGIINMNKKSSGSLIEGGSSADPKGISSILARFGEELKRVIKEKKYTEKKIFETYDLDGNNRIQKTEFLLTSENVLELNIPSRNLHVIFEHFDKDKDDTIDLRELWEAINFDQKKYDEQQHKLSQKSSSGVLNTPRETVLLNFLTSAKKYMREKNISVYQFYTLMDKSKDSYLSRKEIKDLIKNKLEISLSPRDEEIIMNELDKNNDNKVSVKEFTAFMEIEEALKFLNSSESMKEINRSAILKFLYDYMKEKEKTCVDILLDMDISGDGEIDLIELAFGIKKLNNRLSDEDIERFLVLVDTDNSKTVSLKEFKAVMEAYERYLDQEVLITEERRNEILKKLIPLVEGNKDRLKAMTKGEDDNDRYILVKDLRQQMSDINMFTPDDIDLIINPICRPFTTEGRVKYSGLMRLRSIYEQNKNSLRESGLARSRGRELVSKIFSALKKVGVKHKLSNVQLFQCFDMDNNGSITLKEMRYTHLITERICSR